MTEKVDGHLGPTKDIHESDKSEVKWEEKVSQPFQVNQGVKKEGKSRIYLYELYINPLNMYETTGAGYKIGNISVNNTACADNITLISQTLTKNKNSLIWLMIMHIWKDTKYNQQQV